MCNTLKHEEFQAIKEAAFQTHRQKEQRDQIARQTVISCAFKIAAEKLNAEHGKSTLVNNIFSGKMKSKRCGVAHRFVGSKRRAKQANKEAQATVDEQVLERISQLEERVRFQAREIEEKDLQM